MEHSKNTLFNDESLTKELSALDWLSFIDEIEGVKIALEERGQRHLGFFNRKPLLSYLSQTSSLLSKLEDMQVVGLGKPRSLAELKAGLEKPLPWYKAMWLRPWYRRKQEQKLYDYAVSQVGLAQLLLLMKSRSTASSSIVVSSDSLMGTWLERIAQGVLKHRRSQVIKLVGEKEVHAPRSEIGSRNRRLVEICLGWLRSVLGLREAKVKSPRHIADSYSEAARQEKDSAEQRCRGEVLEAGASKSLVLALGEGAAVGPSVQTSPVEGKPLVVSDLIQSVEEKKSLRVRWQEEKKSLERWLQEEKAKLESLSSEEKLKKREELQVQLIRKFRQLRLMFHPDKQEESQRGEATAIFAQELQAFEAVLKKGTLSRGGYLMRELEACEKRIGELEEELAHIKNCLKAEPNNKELQSQAAVLARQLEESRLEKQGIEELQELARDIAKFGRRVDALCRELDRIAQGVEELKVEQAETKERIKEASETATRASEAAGRASGTAGRASETAGRASETAGRASETAGRASEAAGRASETAGRASETAGRASETAGRASEAAGRARKELGEVREQLRATQIAVDDALITIEAKTEANQRNTEKMMAILRETEARINKLTQASKARDFEMKAGSLADSDEESAEVTSPPVGAEAEAVGSMGEAAGLSQAGEKKKELLVLQSPYLDESPRAAR